MDTFQAFGCDVNTIERKTGGLSLPPFIENALIYLIQNGINSVGIFRKSGVKSRITALRQKLEQMISKKEFYKKIDESSQFECCFPNLDYSSCEDYCVYDVADMIKMWLREIKPQPLINKQIISAFKEMSSGNSNPSELILKINVLLTDSQRSILEILLHFLSWFAKNSEINQMNSHNLAICFTPSLCECNSSTLSISKTNGSSSTIDPSANESDTIFNAQTCLKYLIENYNSFSQISASSLPFSFTSQLNETINNNSHNHYQLNSQSHTSLINGGNLLPPKYESKVIISASPWDILNKLLYQRNLFDPTIVEWKILKDNPKNNSDIFQFKTQSSLFLPIKTFTIERKWTFHHNQLTSNESNFNNSKKSKNKVINAITLKETGYLYDSNWQISTIGEGKCQLEISIAADLRLVSIV